MAASASPRLDNSFGAVLVGNSVGLIIYGMTLLQCYRYFRLYPGDSYKMKVLVFAFMMLETLHIIETTHTCYYYLVSNYCESAKLGIGVWSIRILTPTNGAIVFMAQMFYARRLHLLKSCNGVLVIIMVSLSLIALGFTITAAVEGFLQVSFRAWRHVVVCRFSATKAPLVIEELYSLQWIDVVAVAVNLMVDLMLSITLVLFLHRSRSGLRRSNSLVDLLVAYTVNTCVLVSVMNILVLTSIIAWPSTLIYVGISIPTARSTGWFW
ncbi:hypothetical protein BD311DRAFT_751622 [Dichomitus squalens]|uniref:DUF6534 domain-containing protein n=1 Tax=Dichomitus squalens TaxID=114155 RepID=A0A4Q9MWU5_9APHY|nr:hypothetical protein BD311DRAFT_751622 [Dichomitus squalens]